MPFWYCFFFKKGLLGAIFLLYGLIIHAQDTVLLKMVNGIKMLYKLDA